MLSKRSLAFVFVLVQCGAIALAQDHWVATWAASPQAPRNFGPPPPPPPAAANPAQPAPPPAPGAQFRNGLNNQTTRMIVRTSIGGRRVRIQLSNAFNSEPLMVGAAHIAIRAKDSAIVPASDRALTFNGKTACMIPSGATLLSDPVDLEVPQLADLAVSVFVPGDTGAPTMHLTGLHTTYISKQGDQTGQPAIPDADTSLSWYWLSGVDVVAPGNVSTIVAFGDSITDGSRSTPDANRSWPSVLAQRLLANPATASFAVVNEAIAGNRVLRDAAGVNALARFDRDVLAHAGVKWVMLLEGINDIGNGTRANVPAAEAVTSADDIIAGYRQMIERAHTHGLKIVGCTLTPYQGAAYYTESGEAIRQGVNRWIKTSGAFDAVVDFDAATRDPNVPLQIRAEYDSGDHLHPSDAGYKAMADSIDLAIFASKPTPTVSKTR